MDGNPIISAIQSVNLEVCGCVYWISFRPWLTISTFRAVTSNILPGYLKFTSRLNVSEMKLSDKNSHTKTIFHTVLSFCRGIKQFEWLKQVSVVLKTKAKAITMANHSKRKQRNEPMTTRSKYTQPAPSAGNRVRPSRDWILNLIGQVGGAI